jgi:hypothetical protein
VGSTCPASFDGYADSYADVLVPAIAVRSTGCTSFRIASASGVQGYVFLICLLLNACRLFLE